VASFVNDTRQSVLDLSDGFAAELLHFISHMEIVLTSLNTRNTVSTFDLIPAYLEEAIRIEREGAASATAEARKPASGSASVTATPMSDSEESVGSHGQTATNPLIGLLSPASTGRIKRIPAAERKRIAASATRAAEQATLSQPLYQSESDGEPLPRPVSRKYDNNKTRRSRKSTRKTRKQN
jgi:hypothetical protein